MEVEMNSLKKIVLGTLDVLFGVLVVLAVTLNKAAPYFFVVMVTAKLLYPKYPFGWALTILLPLGVLFVTYAVSLVCRLVMARTKDAGVSKK